MSNRVKILSKDELHSLHTGTLLRRRKQLLQCEENIDASNRCGEKAPDPDATGYVEFKTQPQWVRAYQEEKEVLGTREHLPTAEERRQRRQEQTRGSH